MVRGVEASRQWLRAYHEAHRLFADRCYACREELGLESDPDPAALRLDNFGLRGGRFVAIDYGDSFPPLPALWAHLLDVDDAEGVIFRDFAERAGLTAENTDACPCFCGGTFSDGAAGCGMDIDVAEQLAERTLPAETERAEA